LLSDGNYEQIFESYSKIWRDSSESRDNIAVLSPENSAGVRIDEQQSMREMMQMYQ
jgi:hypothetical protein